MLVCSVCNIPLCRIDYEGCRIHFCPDCAGALVDDAPLAQIKGRRERRWTPDRRRELADEAPAADKPIRIRCPKCLMPMRKVPLALGEAGFDVEHCVPCGTWWFDRGELELAQILFEEEQDGRTDEDLARIERLAVVQMQAQDGESGLAAEVARDGSMLTGAGLLFALGPVGALAATALRVVQEAVAAGKAEDAYRRHRAIARVICGLLVLAALAVLCWFLWRLRD